jgi:hypothetical protein
MKPIDLRNATWDSIHSSLSFRLAVVYGEWIIHGPGTTREVSQRSGRDILSLRPRTTDLYQIGLLELIGRQKNEGIYRARNKSEWEPWNMLASAGQQQLI